MKHVNTKRWWILLLSLLFVIGASKLTLAAGISSDQLRLTAPDASGNTPFSVTNLFPGDAVTKDFIVKVKHSQPITLYYHADLRPGSEKLAEVMMVNIQLPDKGLTLYDGLMRDMPSALEHVLAANEKEVRYRITAYLDTSVGNEYQLQSLIADFRWWYAEEAGGGGGSTGGGDDGSEPGTASAATVKLVAEKVLDSSYPRGNDFTFILSDQDHNPVQIVRNQDGLVEFDTLRFRKTGTYTYYITEHRGKDPDMRYDASVYQAVVTIKKKSGRYTATVTYEKDGEAYPVLPRFVNRTVDHASVGDPDIPDPDGWIETTAPVMPDNPKTGDDSNLFLYLTLWIGSLITLILLLLCMRQRKEERA